MGNKEKERLLSIALHTRSAESRASIAEAAQSPAFLRDCGLFQNDERRRFRDGVRLPGVVRLSG
jgi:hypothetical protein